jgi:hypothetical protein
VSEDATFTVTLKGGAGYEAPWLVVRGDNPAEVEESLDVLAQSNLLQKVNDVASLFRGAGAATPVTTGAPASDQGATVTQHPAAAGNMRTCEHGVRVRREGTNARGKWVGYFCALPKGSPGACEVEWGK